MNYVYKYDLPHPETPILMPEGAKLLHVGEQGWGVHLWALVNPTLPVVERKFFVVGTGHGFEDVNAEYIGTVQASSGLVWHVFEKGPI